MATRKRRAKVVEEPVVDVEELEEELEDEEVEEVEEVEEEPVVRRRSRPANKPTSGRQRRKVVEPEEEEEEDEEEEEEDEEEEEVPAPKARSRRRKTVKEEVEEEPPAKPARKSRRAEPKPAPAAKKAKRVTKVKEEAADEEEEVGRISDAQLGDTLLELVEAGASITISKVGGKIVFYNAGNADGMANRAGGRRSAGKRTRAITKKEMYEKAYDPEFLAHYETWNPLTYEEKIAIARKEKLTWEEHETPQVNVMRLTAAYREAHDIPKWRPEYEDKAARDLLLYEGIEAEPLDEDEE